MHTKIVISTFFFILTTMIHAQQNNELPYAEIPEPPSDYSAGAVVSRMLDGLGFRYYWATEGLRVEDLEYRPSETSRTSEETADHILDLSYVILNSALNKVNEPRPEEELSFEEKRDRTLANLAQASAVFRTAGDLGEYKVIFKGKESNREFPFWNQINGPISDAIWHCGQLVTLRRASGNPFNSKVSVFTGKLRE